MPSWSCCSLSTPANSPLRSRSRCRPLIFDPTPRIYCEAPYQLSLQFPHLLLPPTQRNFGTHFSGGQVTLYFSYFQVVTPYFPYSKGDQKSSLRSPISSKLIANMLKRLSIFLLGHSHIELLGSAQIYVFSFKQRPNVFLLDV